MSGRMTTTMMVGEGWSIGGGGAGSVEGNGGDGRESGMDGDGGGMEREQRGG